jgi:hypothetical protein
VEAGEDEEFGSSFGKEGSVDCCGGAVGTGTGDEELHCRFIKRGIRFDEGGMKVCVG